MDFLLLGALNITAPKPNRVKNSFCARKSNLYFCLVRTLTRGHSFAFAQNTLTSRWTSEEFKSRRHLDKPAGLSCGPLAATKADIRNGIRRPK